MAEVVLLEWTFSPPDYFEETVRVTYDDYQLTIADGKVEARIDSSVFDAQPTMRADIHSELDNRFFAVQLLTHRVYKLSKSGMTRIDRDGRRYIFLEAEPIVAKATLLAADFRVTSKDGTVATDTRRDRMERRRTLAELAARHANDSLLARLRASYRAAVEDPNDELIHLYEIRDAVGERFGGESAACATLGISVSYWSRLGALANSESLGLRQGRHRGKAAFRDATAAELAEARAIARGMIEAYLAYLDTD